MLILIDEQLLMILGKKIEYIDLTILIEELCIMDIYNPAVMMLIFLLVIVISNIDYVSMNIIHG
jgi:hypothetical protein